MTGKRKRSPPSSPRKLKKRKVCFTFKGADVYHFSIIMICKEVIAPLFRQLLKWLNKDWDCETVPFKTYLEQKHNIAEDVFNESLNSHQKGVIRDDPSGKSWDISLTYIALGYPWTKAVDHNELGQFITALKNERNYISHPKGNLNENEYKEKCKVIRNNLENILSKVRLYCPHVTQGEVDGEFKKIVSFIDGIMTLDKVKYVEYRKTLEEHRRFVMTEGKKSLIDGHKGRQYFDATPYLHLHKGLPVEDTFVEMVLEKTVNGKETPIGVKDFLDTSDSLFYLEGRAGVGKSSLLKYLPLVWASGKNDVKGLDEYDLFFHIACRNDISSFDQFLRLSMPTVLKEIDIATLRYILYGLKSIIVVDGFDEKNGKTVQVLEEIFSLKKEYKFTLLVTSRPEATAEFYKFASSHAIPIKHIKVSGVHKSRQTEFIQKYIYSIGFSYDILPILEFINRTQHRLSETWELPYNLLILTTLWMHDPDIIKRITTSLELHWENYRIVIAKLKERLLRNDDTKHLHASIIQEKIENFSYVLCEVSLICLANDNINLPVEAHGVLSRKCAHLEFPSMDEMVAAFLKPAQSETGKPYYSFHHKGVQDFLAAWFVLMRLKSTSNIDIDHVRQRFLNDLALKNAPEDLLQQMKLLFDNYKMMLDSSGASGSHILKGGQIRTLLNEITGVSDAGLWKFHNMLLSLIGILYTKGEDISINNELKQESLELLRDTGVKDSDHWLCLLNNIRCDELMAIFISQETSVLKGKIKITDRNLYAYNSLFGALKSLSDDSREVEIRVEEDIEDVGDFLSHINRLKRQVSVLKITEKNIDSYTSILRNIEEKEKFVNPEKVDVEIEMKTERIPMLSLWNELRRNGLFNVRRLNLECDFIALPKAGHTMNIDDSNPVDDSVAVDDSDTIDDSEVVNDSDTIDDSEVADDSDAIDDCDAIKEMLESCEEFTGIWNMQFQMHQNMKKLKVRLPNLATGHAFLASLKTPSTFEELEIKYNRT